MLKEFYHGRRVLVTGHTGFKGSWLSMWLRMLGAEVMGVALEPPGTPSMFGSLRLHELMDSRHTDINDYPALEKTLREFEPEVVIHMAALSLVRPSYKDPLATLNTNILGTAKVLEACRHCPATRAVIIVTSDKCYRNNEWVWGYRENDPMGGHDPYSASKAAPSLWRPLTSNPFFRLRSTAKAIRPPWRPLARATPLAAATGAGQADSRLFSAPCIRARPFISATPQRCAPGSMCWNVFRATSCFGARLCQEGPRYGCGWNFAPMDMGDIWPVGKVVEHICRLWGNGRVVTDKARSPMRRTCSALTAPSPHRFGLAAALPGGPSPARNRGLVQGMV